MAKGRGLHLEQLIEIKQERRQKRQRNNTIFSKKKIFN